VKRNSRGLTLVEMVAAIAVLAILTTVAMPLGRNAMIRKREAELRRDLSLMRAAIDRYHYAALLGAIKPWDPDWQQYPPDLETLVEGVETTAAEAGRTRVEKFLREIPVDPMTGEADWVLRSYQNEPDDTAWDGENLFDVRSASPGIALDGTNYSDW
jgi:general secretion pathway protein G